MDTKSFSIRLPLNAPAIIIDAELFIPVIDQKIEKTVSIKTKALIDTGANSSCISERLANACRLRPISAMKMISAHGMSIAQIYEVSVKLPNEILFESVTVVEVSGSKSFDVIIGMDILSKGDFVYSSNEETACFSMRIPSAKELIDFSKRPL